ncbi:MAG TPA: hypothetical protein VES89_03015 [Candidatus Competibacteraceae bacterium]|nr:hypothetical protein [Candidatus Competibacteraceae bacterium]
MASGLDHGLHVGRGFEHKKRLRKEITGRYPQPSTKAQREAKTKVKQIKIEDLIKSFYLSETAGKCTTVILL